jgi:hypothetical protein
MRWPVPMAVLKKFFYRNTPEGVQPDRTAKRDFIIQSIFLFLFALFLGVLTSLCLL